MTQTQAVMEFKKALDLRPNSSREKLSCRLALIRAGRIAEGIAQLKGVQQKDPKLPHTWFNLGIQYKKAGETEHRNGIGAVARVTSVGGTQWQTVHSGSRYCSASDLALTFGLGKDTSAAAIEIDWPSGTKQKPSNVAANQQLVVMEP